MSLETISKESLENWRKLYDIAIKFKNLKCWEWIDDSQIFGVQNPENNEIGYCCVLGYYREVFGLAVYPGTEGLEAYLKIASQEVPFNDIEILRYQNCLMVTFENRSFLEDEDLKIINALELKFRGSNAWPLFRNYKPGYYPWYIDESEVKFLHIVLEQSIDVCMSLKNNINKLVSPKPYYYLVKVPQKTGNSLIWHEQWLKPVPLETKEVISFSVDDMRIRKILKKKINKSGIWEIDYFYSPHPVREKDERPLYPYIFLWIDKDSFFILHHYMTQNYNYYSEFLDQFYDVIEEYKLIPQKILVKREELYKIINPIAELLGIEVKLVKKLPAIKNAQTSLGKHFK
ncbi:MAG: hypothetical protein M1326_02965 [Cyanobacteria bacterium]|nr:hypothetical protein [Cyanobacteriota bacterium]